MGDEKKPRRYEYYLLPLL